LNAGSVSGTEELRHKYNNLGAGMYPLMLSLVAVLAFAGTGFAQTKHSAPKAPTVLRGTSAESSAKKVAAKPVAQKASMAQSATRPLAKPSTQQ
jgi:hypothetical protein